MQADATDPAPHVDPRIAEAVACIRHQATLQPVIGLVLGSGFADVATAVEPENSWPYTDLPGFLAPSVPGHAGRLILGRLGSIPVAVLAGRAHFYEGHSLAAVTFPIRVLAALGIRDLCLTNAAGGIRPDLEPGTFVALTDHLLLMGDHPLRGITDGSAFVDLSQVYDPDLRDRLHAAARTEGIPLSDGVYAAVSGPAFETPAEIRAFARLGADLVGMSTAPEAIVAVHCGLRVVALSCITNRAAGLGGRISHAEVLDHGRRAGPLAARLLRQWVRV